MWAGMAHATPHRRPKIKGVADILTAPRKPAPITASGTRLLALANEVDRLSNGKWGALDSLGWAEQRGIASRMFASYPMLFTGRSISAISSYVPRLRVSMYSFCHEISRLSDKTAIIASSGTQYSPLMRPFDSDRDFRAYSKKKPYMKVLDEFKATDMPGRNRPQRSGQWIRDDRQAGDAAHGRHILSDFVVRRRWGLR